MSELLGIYAIWKREFKVFLREKSRIISSIINPLMWLVIFGSGLGSSITISNINYQSFIFPGILVMSTLFSSIFYGVYIVWDRKIDFLKEVLVSPISRPSIFIGKILGGATDSMMQVSLLFIMGFLMQKVGILSGVSFSIQSVVLAFALLLLTTSSVVSVGLILGSIMDSPEGFQLIVSFLIFPLFFLSGALFPLKSLPAWLNFLTTINPLTYTVDGLRHILLGTPGFPLLYEFSFALIFAIIMIIIGSKIFERMKV